MTDMNETDLPTTSLERAARAVSVNIVTFSPQHGPYKGSTCFFAYEQGLRTGVFTTDKHALRDLLVAYRGASDTSLVAFGGVRGFELKTVREEAKV